MSNEKKCEICGNAYTSIRDNSKFCSSACRNKNHRRKSKSDNIRSVELSKSEAVLICQIMDSLEKVSRFNRQVFLGDKLDGTELFKPIYEMEEWKGIKDKIQRITV